MEEIVNFNQILKSYKINAQCLDYKKTDNYCNYDIKLLSTSKVRDISKYLNEISLALKLGNPYLHILHEEGIIRLEYIFSKSKTFNLKDYLKTVEILPGKLNCLLGKNTKGDPFWVDFAEFPHTIISGTSGSGKSTLLHNIINNLRNLNSAEIFLVDPKRIEFSSYKNLSKINIFDSYQDINWLLDFLIDIMNQRLVGLQKEKINLSPIMVIIDEFADLILSGDHLFEKKICKLAQQCRAAEIYFILSTQRPSHNLINGDIKANFTGRIACKTVSAIDSKIILDASGAENLLGRGDALIKNISGNIERFQVAYSSAQDI